MSCLVFSYSVETSSLPHLRKSFFDEKTRTPHSSRFSFLLQGIGKESCDIVHFLFLFTFPSSKRLLHGGVYIQEAHLPRAYRNVNVS